MDLISDTVDSDDIPTRIMGLQEYVDTLGEAEGHFSFGLDYGYLDGDTFESQPVPEGLPGGDVVLWQEPREEDYPDPTLHPITWRMLLARCGGLIDRARFAIASELNFLPSESVVAVMSDDEVDAVKRHRREEIDRKIDEFMKEKGIA